MYVEHGDYRWWHFTVYLKVAKTVDLKSTHHREKIVTIWDDGC